MNALQSGDRVRDKQAPHREGTVEYVFEREVEVKWDDMRKVMWTIIERLDRKET